MREATLDGVEWTCVACGHRDYGAGFEVLDLPEEGRRGARHNGAAL